ncbi:MULTISPECIES: DUF4956 domain-containing protein [Emticicia]|uniref:DUF4956 domain-containing protein n=1 Tax=Emticicia TaxID=312278 RepID=UPI0020A0A58F|nr:MULTISPECIES: DUF4956 domain-containing protein [Emticicia]UTA68760.1 DUF4956 domain-containing protein [Emticicia sp. 21SJ11W-3]
MEEFEGTSRTINQFLGNSFVFEFGMRFLLNMTVILLLVRGIYYNRYKNKDFVFTFFLFNVVNFLICFLLSATKLKMGFAFGLFAIFSIIRYRTVTVPVREMGYFFVCVAVGIINALTPLGSGNYELIIADILLVGVTFGLEHGLNIKHENFREVRYEKIDLVVPARREEMIEDLRKRIGLPIHRVEILHVDFLRDVARVHAFYYSNENENKSAAYGSSSDD